jgi:hypothetical protein
MEERTEFAMLAHITTQIIPFPKRQFRSKEIGGGRCTTIFCLDSASTFELIVQS